ncbi:hypothetical protein GCM10028796_31380 [Ramlibacter monticola]|uniref:Uncharacterized protein n=1 Tax=Ramlibacter monticola TaxID=1926872 RepID=A0A937CWY4_9BURK|nr:PhaM family polyhydroxyalkanoate granule multifunctional regulatory protein [Ramlibacter monticola]MBL0394789.1 hypothetical protein [Ramlibacter monticola]
MSDENNFGFAKLVPGFDFLQNLAKGASQTMSQMPGLSNWVAPTLSVEELEKRIAELKAVQFWLEQNGRALAATIQALEVQKMTLATLKGMNFSMGELANALQVKTGETMASGARKMGEAAEAAAGAVSGVAEAAAEAANAVRRKAGGKKAEEPAATEEGSAGVKPVDPLQWWGALTQQFQEIAANAMKDAMQKTSVDTARNMAMKAATGMAKAAAGVAKTAVAPGSAPAPARKAAARKATARKTRAKKTAT